MVEIIPAVIPHSFTDLEERLARVREVAKHVQVDIVDGHFAHGKSWPYKDHATFEKIVQQEHGLPFWEELDFEFDLMITDPAPEIMNYVHAGGSRVILHARSQHVLPALQTLVDLREEGGAFSIYAGIALMPDDQPETLEPFEAQFDFVQVMGVNRIGRQGESFEQKALYLVERLHHRYPTLKIQVDGGVKLENVAALAKAGATRLVAGSAIFGSDDPVAAYKQLVEAANT